MSTGRKGAALGGVVPLGKGTELRGPVRREAQRSRIGRLVVRLRGYFFWDGVGSAWTMTLAIFVRPLLILFPRDSQPAGLVLNVTIAPFVRGLLPTSWLP